MEDFGKLCKALRKARKMTQTEVADIAGVGKRDVGNIELGNSVTWLALEAVLGVFGYELRAVKHGEEK